MMTLVSNPRYETPADVTCDIAEKLAKYRIGPSFGDHAVGHMLDKTMASGNGVDDEASFSGPVVKTSTNSRWITCCKWNGCIRSPR